MDREVFVELERRCTLRCRYCFAWQGGDGANPFTAEEGLARLFAFLAGLRHLGFGTLALTGGEPTMHPHLTQVVRAGCYLGFHTTMLTNGIGLDRSQADALAEAGLTEAFVSLDAVFDHVNRELRSASAPVLWAIHHLRAAGVPVEISCVLTRVNLATVPALLDLARAEGCQVSANPVHLPPGHPERARLGLDDLPPAERDLLHRVLTDLAAFDPERAAYYRFVADRYLEGRAYAKPNGCEFGSRALVVRMEGDVFPCFHRADGYGNLLREDVRAVLSRVGAGRRKEDFGGCFGEHCYSLQADLPRLTAELQPAPARGPC